jgi:hypothetical protein
MIEIAEHGIILKQVCEGFRVRQIVDRDNIDVRITDCGAVDIASDAPKAVYANLHRHCENALLRMFQRLSHPQEAGRHTMLRRLPQLGSKLAGSKEAQDYAA